MICMRATFPTWEFAPAHYAPVGVSRQPSCGRGIAFGTNELKAPTCSLAATRIQCSLRSAIEVRSLRDISALSHTAEAKLPPCQADEHMDETLTGLGVTAGAGWRVRTRVGHMIPPMLVRNRPLNARSES